MCSILCLWPKLRSPAAFRQPLDCPQVDEEQQRLQRAGIPATGVLLRVGKLLRQVWKHIPTQDSYFAIGCMSVTFQVLPGVREGRSNVLGGHSTSTEQRNCKPFFIRKRPFFVPERAGGRQHPGLLVQLHGVERVDAVRVRGGTPWASHGGGRVRGSGNHDLRRPGK